MKHYRDEKGNIFAFEEDGSQDDYIPETLALLSAEELSALRAEHEAARAPTPEQLLVMANDKRDELLNLAALRIAPLQDAVDLDQATPEDAANLKLWKKYRVAVNRIHEQPGFPVTIEWPEQPAQ